MGINISVLISLLLLLLQLISVQRTQTAGGENAYVVVPETDSEEEEDKSRNGSEGVKGSLRASNNQIIVPESETESEEEDMEVDITQLPPSDPQTMGDLDKVAQTMFKMRDRMTLVFGKCVTACSDLSGGDVHNKYTQTISTGETYVKYSIMKYVPMDFSSGRVVGRATDLPDIPEIYI